MLKLTLGFCIGFLLACLIAGHLFNKPVYAQMKQAYNICLKSHYEISGSTEQACGDALDSTHTEFLCNQDGKYCWLEVK